MKKLSMLLVLVLAAILAVACATKQAGTGNFPGTTEFTEKQMADHEKMGYLGGYHMTEQGVDCISCHGGTAYVDDSEKAVNEACVDCHGGYADVAKLTNATDINPHDSHLGDVNCTSCHVAHAPSFVYCNNCHTFDELQISHAGQKAVYSSVNPSKYNNAKPNFVIQTDVVVIGAGGTGMVAALTAKDAGAKVIILEKMPITGGNTQLSAGGMNAAWTRYQKSKNIKDDPETMYLDTMKGGQNKSIPELARKLAYESDASMEWLTKNKIILNNPGMGGGATNARFHAPEGGAVVGAYLTAGLKRLVAQRGIDVRVNSKVVKILTDNTGTVTGVLVEGKHSGIYQINASSVVLASGGFSANSDLVVKYQPSYKGMSTSNQPGAKGDGVALGEDAGAQAIDMEMIQIHPTIAAGSGILITEAVRGRGAIVVNHDGVRIMDEMTTRDKASAAILAQKIPTAFLILDDDTRARLKQIDGYFHLHLVHQGNTPEELAKAINVPADELKNTIERYNGFVKAGEDKDFGRKSMPQQIGKGKYYAIEINPGVHYTMGGLKINTDAQVIGTNGQPVKNLYAGGEVTGGVHGANRLGGNSISETITFGRTAGMNAAKNSR